MQDRILVNAPRRVFDGFGSALRAASRAFSPRSADELLDLLHRCWRESVAVTFRGAGRSYGDASINAGGVVFDLTRMKRVLSWNPRTGVAEVEPGFTIGDLWQMSLPHGFWPAVVPGTMAPTLGGCLAMNVHGKNNFQVGPTGDHVLEFNLATPDGRTLRCNREENADVFHAAIGAAGSLGVFTRIKLKLKPVETGLLRVEPIQTRNLHEVFQVFDERVSKADYLVGWIDAFAEGDGFGRGLLHQGNYLHFGEVKGEVADTLHVDQQGLPPHILGVPRTLMWRFMKPFWNPLGWRLMNFAKYWAASINARGYTYQQSLVAFSFLLDYVPGWRRCYEPRGFLQFQPFVPHDKAEDVFRELLKRCQREGMPPYLVVLKRHRPDPFLLTHALDGYSLAMDFPVPRMRERLGDLCRAMTELVLAAGGKFYFAKDSVLQPDDVERMFGPEKLAAYAEVRARLDPEGLMQSNLLRRTLLPLVRKVSEGTLRASG